jgi:hypothetical protein
MNKPGAKKKNQVQEKTTLHQYRPEDKDEIQAAQFIVEQLRDPRSSLPDHPTSRSLRQKQILQMQRLHGNDFVQRLLAEGGLPSTPKVRDAAVEIQRMKNGATSDIQRDPVEGSTPSTSSDSGVAQEQTGDEPASAGVLRDRYRKIQSLLSEGTLSPDGQAALREEAERVKEALVDAVTSESLVLDLNAFNNISINVPKGEESLSITVRAAYFIHSKAGKENVQQARYKSKFSKIKKTLKKNNDISLMETTKGKEMHSGTAIQFGKGTPEDVRRFVQEAVNNGTIERYARSKKKLGSDKPLGELDAKKIQKITQQWIYDNGVGVDCSGYAVQTLFNAREKVREELAGLGVSESDMPPELSSKVRGASNFRKETRVSKPSELRPGDAWVTPSGGHIRIVTGVKKVKRGDKEIIEFTTAESSGGAASREKGQIAKTKRTAGLDDWGRIKGSFHRL